MAIKQTNAPTAAQRRDAAAPYVDGVPRGGSSSSSAGAGTSAAPAAPVVGFNQSALSTQAIQKAVGVKVDGIYGPLTTAAVVAFQNANGLKPDGIVGPLTQAALQKMDVAGSSIINNQNGIVQTTGAITASDNKNASKIDQKVQLSFGGSSNPTGVYGTPITDSAGNVVGKEMFDSKTGKPLTDPNAPNYNENDKTGQITTKDGATYSLTAPKDFSYQLPTLPEGSKFVFGSDGKPFVIDKAGTVTSNPTADAEFNKNQKVNQDIIDRENLYDTYKAGLDLSFQTLIDGIKSQAALLRAKTEKLNEVSLGLKRVQGFRTGSTEYTPEIGVGILKNEEEEGLARLNEIDTNMNVAIAQAVSAKNEKDFALLDKRLNTIDALQKSKEDTITNIYKAYADAVKATNDAIRQANTDKRAQDDQAIQELTTAAPQLIKQYDSLKTQAEKDTWLQIMMKKTGLEGTIILGALEKVRLDITNKTSIIANREDNNNGTSAADKKRALDNDIAEAILTFQKEIKDKDWYGVDPGRYEFYKEYMRTTYGPAAVLQYEKAVKDAKLEVDYAGDNIGGNL